jgi:UPF0755 protein
MLKKIFFISLIIGIILGIFVVVIYKSNNINTSSDYILYLEKDVPFENVMDSLEKHKVLKNSLSATIFLTSYPIKNVKAGRYKLNKSMSNLELFRKLKYGFEDPIKLTISTATFIDEIAFKIEQKFRFKADTILQFLNTDNTKAKYNFSHEQRLCNIYPMTYDIPWNSSLEQLFEKINKGKTDFWTPERKQKAQNMNMSENDVYILASMIQKEYSKKEERSKIAGVLMNRLQINMPLQVDATCKYATKDFSAKRVTGTHLRCVSPYNTYTNRGLPPGPICIPELSTIDACLNYEKHDFLYYCADPSLNGFHLFNKTWEDHQAVAQNYYKKVNSLNL